MTVMIPAWVDGTLTPIEKLEAHQRGLRHKAVSVFVLCGADVLLQQRALGKYHTPGLWANSCCTHPHWDEAPRDCAQRRLGEELGLPPLPLDWRGQVEYRADVGAGLIEHEQVDIFVTHVDSRPAVAPNPSEVMATEWRSLRDLQRDLSDRPARYTPWLRIYMADHLTLLFGGDNLADNQKG